MIQKWGRDSFVLLVGVETWVNNLGLRLCL